METFSSQLGARLREVREGLGLSQASAAAVAGVSREHWGRCERGLTVPGSEMLAAFAAAGADAQYVLTGITMEAHRRLDLLEHVMAIAADVSADYNEVRALGARLKVLLEHYLACSPADQARIGQLAELLAVQAKGAK